MITVTIVKVFSSFLFFSAGAGDPEDIGGIRDPDERISQERKSREDDEEQTRRRNKETA